MNATRKATSRAAAALRREYYGNGRWKSVGRYSNGKRTGLWKAYDKNGRLEKERRY